MGSLTVLRRGVNGSDTFLKDHWLLCRELVETVQGKRQGDQLGQYGSNLRRDDDD